MIFNFIVYSGFAALVNILTGQVLYGFLGLSEGWQYSFSVSTAFIAGMAVSYFLNRRYTFHPSGRKMSREATDFFLVSIGGLLLTTGLAQFLYSRAGEQVLMVREALALPFPPETISHVVAVGLTGVYSFTTHKYFSFRRAHAL